MYFVIFFDIEVVRIIKDKYPWISKTFPISSPLKKRLSRKYIEELWEDHLYSGETPEPRQYIEGMRKFGRIVMWYEV